ncbi:MAG: DUF58 domain-containing protein [Spirochaetales bacterium]|nr:DUF58 domain-containing protein [Spirochaetales bacterium]
MRKIIILLSIFIILFFPYWFIQLFAFLILIVYFLSFFYSKTTYNSVIFKRDQQIIRAYKHQIITIDFDIENRSILPIHYISIYDRTGKLDKLTSSKFILSLNKNEKKKLSYQIKTMARGEYFIGPVIIKSGDPLGLFPWEYHLESKSQEKNPGQCKIIVFPRVFTINREIQNGNSGGDIIVKNKIDEDITRVKSIREYIPGDDIRHISWKVSAHLGSLFTREFLQSISSPVLLLLNLTTEDYPVKYRYSYIETAIEYCASLVNYFTSLKQEIGFLSTGFIDTIHPRVSFGQGNNHSMFLLEKLAVINSTNQAHDVIDLLNKSHLSLQNGTRIILIGPELSADQIRLFVSKQGKNCLLEHIPITETKIKNKHPGIKTFDPRKIYGKALYV